LALGLGHGEGDELDLRCGRRQLPDSDRSAGHVIVQEEDLGIDMLEKLESILNPGRNRDHLEALITPERPRQRLPVKADLTENEKPDRHPCSLPWPPCSWFADIAGSFGCYGNPVGRIY